MTRVIINRLLLGLIGLTCAAAGLWLLAARFADHLLPGAATRYLTTGPHQRLAGPTTRTHLSEAVHGWWLPGSLAAGCLLALMFLAWQRMGLRATTVRVGSAHLDGRALARQIAADAQGLEGVASADAPCVTADPLRVHLTLRLSGGAAPADVLARVREQLAPRLTAACTGTVPQFEVRFIGAHTARTRPARVR